MGMSHEINGNHCFLQSVTTTPTPTLLLTSGQQMPQLVTGLDLNALNAFNTTFNQLDLNQSVIINTNDLTNIDDTAGQQFLLVSSAVDLVNGVNSVMTNKGCAVSAQPVQMLLQTQDMSPAVNVIQVPTNLLLTDNNLIVIPQEGITLEMPTLETSLDVKSQTAIVYNGSPQLLSGQTVSYQNGEQLVVNLNDCIAINAVNDKSNANQFLATNQIIGIIDADTSEPKLLTADPSGQDLNAFLASTMAPTVEPECDPNEAKGWLNDSLIAYRALAAFKKVMPNETTSPTSGVRVHK